MTRVNVYEMKTHLPRYLKRVKRGERLLICNRNKPVAELRPVEEPRQEPRPIGLLKGQFKVTGAFFKPLPKSFLKAFSH